MSTHGNKVFNTVRSHKIIASTGTTNAEVNDMASGVGFLLGQAAVEELLNREFFRGDLSPKKFAVFRDQHLL